MRLHSVIMNTTSSPRLLPVLYALVMNSCGAIAAVTFGLMSLLIGADVVFRNLGIELIPASVEISEYMLMIATFIAAPWLLYRNEHIRVDVILNVLPRMLTRILDTVGNLIGLVVAGVLTWQSIVVLADYYQQDSLVFKELVFPEWWLMLPLLIGSALMTLEFLRRTQRSLIKIAQA